MAHTPVLLTSTEQALEFVLQKAPRPLRVATPLGLGKPNFLLNALYDHVKQHPETPMSIFTALSLTPPSMSEDLARRFFEPFAARQWGQDYPLLHYYQDAVRDQVPSNVVVHEFYFQSGSALKSHHLQRHYQSINYTHVAWNVFRQDINVILQLIAKRGEGANARYSLSCNPDLTLDLADLYRNSKKPLLMVGVVHPDLPFLEGESEVPPEFFDAIHVNGPEHELFALPREPISHADHLIGLQASQLVADEGTIQVGIGSLPEAVGAGLVLRQKQNAEYARLIDDVRGLNPINAGLTPRTEKFERGLYGLSEMVSDVFMHLRRAGILKREVLDEKSGARTHLHGAFYLGSKEFYQWLRDLSPVEMKGLRMTRVSKVNDLYDPNELLLRAQRIRARFFNACMQVSLLGEAISETLPNGGVVSGIGGQYNFVAMAQELPDARSVLMLRSTYQAGSETKSNIIWTPAHVSIPRHLRDIIVTEYGVADVRGKTDEETIQCLLAVADSRFQDELLEQAKRSGKIAGDYRIPEEHRRNSPERLHEFCSSPERAAHFAPFPFGSDFTPEEERIALALQRLQADAKKSKLRVLKNALVRGSSGDFTAELKRMKLESPRSFSERLNRKILLAYLR